MMTTRLIKVIKVFSVESYDNEYIRSVCTEFTDWMEVSDKEFEKLRAQLEFANQYRYILNHDFTLLIIEATNDNSLEQILQSVERLQNSITEQKRKEEEKKAALAAQRAAKSVEKKKKQLEKLKQELGEQ